MTRHIRKSLVQPNILIHPVPEESPPEEIDGVKLCTGLGIPELQPTQL